MRLRLLIFLFLLGCAASGYSQIGKGYAASNLRKTWVFKVDPAGVAMNDFRVAYERHIDGDWFWSVQPGYYLRNQPLQKRYGANVRLGIRKYFFSDYSPHGFFLYLGGGYRYTRVNHHSEVDYEIEDRAQVHAPGGTFSIGHQWLFRPRRDFAFSIQGGPEYFYPFETGDLREDLWNPGIYEPIYRAGNITALKGLRIYLSIEIGFAYRQKNRHNRRWGKD